MEKVKSSYIIKLIILGFFLSLISTVFVMKLIFAISTITMPDFTGMTIEKAQKKASRMKIDLKVDAEDFSRFYARGYVMQQDISKGTKIKKGRTLYVLVSKGSKLVRIPSITGQPKNTSLVLLKNNGLNAGYETAIESGVFKEDYIIAQSPAAGQEAPAGISINFLRSSGKKGYNYMMPDLRGKDIFTVFDSMRRSNLLIEKIEIEINENLASGSIISQQPGPGYMVNGSKHITLKASVKESDEKLKKRIIKINYVNPSQVPQLIKITVLSLNGSETVYNEVAQPNEEINVNATVRGASLVQIFNGTELVKETEMSN